MAASNLNSNIREAAWLLGRLGRKLAVSAVPIPAHLWIATARGRFMTSVCGVPQRVKKNIDQALGGIEPGEREQIAARYRRFAEATYLWRILPHLPGFRRSDRWPVDGLENLENAISDGRGVILLTAHLGFPHLIPDILALHGYEVRQLIAERDGLEKRIKIEAWLEKASKWKIVLYRKGHLYSESIRGCDIVASLDVRPILSGIKANEIFLIAGDGLRATEFKMFRVLGQEYPVPTGFVKIALLTGAAVLPAFSIPENGRIRTTILPPLRLDPEAGIGPNLQGYVDVLNEQLQRTPHLWQRWNRANWFEKVRKWAEEAEADPFGIKTAWSAED